MSDRIPKETPGIDFVELPNFAEEPPASHPEGVRGWLLFFVIVFFVNSLNIITVPFAARQMNWQAIWNADKVPAVYFVSSIVAEFTAAVLSAVAAVLIIIGHRAARCTVYAHCLLMIGVSLVGLFMVDAIVETAKRGINVLYTGGYAKYIPAFLNVRLDAVLRLSLFVAYSVVILTELAIILYFRFSRRVKSTLRG